MGADGGATAISTLNQYLVNVTRDAGLKKRPGGRADRLAIYDGAGFRFDASERTAPLVAKLVARYGVAPARVLPRLRATVANLTRVYGLQARNASFATPRALLEALGLYALTQTTAYDYLAALGVPRAFVDEVVDGASRDNYNQDGGLNAFADLVSLAGAGLEGDVFELADGTRRIPEVLLAAARADVRLGAAVAAVRRRAARGGGLEVVERGGAATAVDAVVVATPLEFAALALPPDAAPGAPRPFEATYVALAAGALNASRFGARARDLDAILTVETAAVEFSCIGNHGDVAANASVYKVMSRAYLDDAAVAALVPGNAGVARANWNATGAYPKLAPTPGDSWPPFVLGKGLFYANMESPVSCMETQLIAAKNAALLAAAHVAAL